MNKKCHLGKRKGNDSNDDHESNKGFQSSDSEITCFPNSTSSIAETVLDARKEESRSIADSWMEELKGFDCDLDFANIIPGNSSMFGFDNEHFMTNLDSFVLP